MAVPASGINLEEALSAGLPCAATLGISNTGAKAFLRRRKHAHIFKGPFRRTHDVAVKSPKCYMTAVVAR